MDEASVLQGHVRKKTTSGYGGIYRRKKGTSGVGPDASVWLPRADPARLEVFSELEPNRAQSAVKQGKKTLDI